MGIVISESSRYASDYQGAVKNMKSGDFAARLGEAEAAITREGFGHLNEDPDRNKYFRLADANGLINYKGVIFQCDYDTNTLTLGDCSDRSKCLHIPLSGGGSLLVNRDSLGDLNAAISMFSAEDIGRILRAIELDKLARDNEMELADEEFAALLNE
ncbi:MAG: hypothetical protein NC180_07355 [Muribaculaceae bacterium]|nr:hypothetical protein [Roseburia sp.]MCM1429952.1 hypothetical protein [Muribaculaceae bacterium]MCM1493021.1 hypothetical protein [Muribaculaceae bacterium]